MDSHASLSPPCSSSQPSGDATAYPSTTPVKRAGSSELDETCPQLSPDDPSPSQSAEQERHPKGRRKRTVAADKAILESAYLANPKPDKTARLDIVERVSLNEKEVQIWFQNRRQNDRRKSRPLSPQEIAALRYGGMQILSPDPMAFAQSRFIDHVSTSPTHRYSMTDPPSLVSPTRSEPGRRKSADDLEQLGKPAPMSGTTGDLQSPVGSDKASPREPSSSDESQNISRSFPGSVGYLANRWNNSSSFSTPSTLGHVAGDDSITLEPFRPATSSPALPSSAPLLPLPASQSSQSSQHFRISLSLEGKAEVVSAIPSPPHLPPPRPMLERIPAQATAGRRPSLHRSHSTQSVVTLPPISTLTGSLPGGAGALPPRLTRGRARDVHAWEFCCDAENQEDALTVQAKHESRGSAIAAISLLRSTTSTGGGASPLQPSSSAKRNAAPGRGSHGAATKRPKLGRASSTVGRLQTSFDKGEDKAALTSETAADKASAFISGRDKVKVSMLLSPSGNDSDKENWSPDEDGNPPPHRRHHQESSARRPPPVAAQSRRALHEQKGGEEKPLLARASTAPAGHRRGAAAVKGAGGVAIFEDDEQDERERRPDDEDDEVQRFMRGEVSPSKKGDVVAIAGLLSLSQGNWR